jgi:hypothetical protein
MWMRDLEELVEQLEEQSPESDSDLGNYVGDLADWELGQMMETFGTLIRPRSNG